MALQNELPLSPDMDVVRSAGVNFKADTSFKAYFE